MARRLRAGTLPIAFVTLTLPLVACAQEPDVRLSLEQLRTRMAKGGVVVVDVRTEAAWAEGHIPGALSIPFDQLPSRLGELGKANAVVAYCA